MSDTYIREIDGEQNVKFFPELVTARPKKVDVECDDDGDYQVSDFIISETFSYYDIWKAAQENPDMSLDDFLDLKYMHSTMGV